VASRGSIAAADHQRFRRAIRESGEVNPAEMKAQIEVLRKMLLAMVEDIRVVLLRWPRAPRPCAITPKTPTNCGSRWRAKRWSSIRRWPTGSACGS
jgi:hypothetical protein